MGKQEMKKTMVLMILILGISLSIIPALAAVYYTDNDQTKLGYPTSEVVVVDSYLTISYSGTGSSVTIYYTHLDMDLWEFGTRLFQRYQVALQGMINDVETKIEYKKGKSGSYFWTDTETHNKYHWPFDHREYDNSDEFIGYRDYHEYNYPSPNYCYDIDYIHEGQHQYNDDVTISNGEYLDIYVTLTVKGYHYGQHTNFYLEPFTIVHSYHKAFYSTGGGGGGGGCPNLLAWNGEDFENEGVLNIHNEDNPVFDVTLLHQISTEMELIENKYYFLKLFERAEGYTFSHSFIDQVLLYAIADDGTWYLIPLKKALHSNDGNVKNSLKHSDDIWTETYKGDEINLVFEIPGKLDRFSFKEFIFIIEGHNPFKN
ncbi:MAG: hypothetical protein ACXABI_05200 [Candidatus Hodarchaeales archaeon]